MGEWHSRPVTQIMKELDSGPEGLTGREGARRLEKAGLNQLEAPKGPSMLARIWGQLKDPMILVLLGAAGLSLAASGGEDWLDGAIILVIVLVNGIISISPAYIAATSPLRRTGRRARGWLSPWSGTRRCEG